VAWTRRPSPKPRLDFRAAEESRLGRTWKMELPPGVADPLFLHELALELKMPVGEMCQRMSAHELTVLWPAFFSSRERLRKHLEEKEQR
jgi:hypothetical protein